MINALLETQTTAKKLVRNAAAVQCFGCSLVCGATTTVCCLQNTDLRTAAYANAIQKISSVHIDSGSFFS